MVAAATSNLAGTYELLGRLDEGLRLRQDVYSRTLKLLGKEHEETLLEANAYAVSLISLRRFEEAKSLMRKTIPVARRVLGKSHEITIRLSWTYTRAPCNDPDATLDDFREAELILEDAARTARRVLGPAHPVTVDIDAYLRHVHETLRARETHSSARP